VEQVEQRVEQRKARRRRSQLQDDDEESVIGDFLFNSIYIGVPSNQDAQDLRRQINRNIDDLASETESVPMSGMSRPSAYSSSPRPKPRRRLKLELSKAHKIAFELKGLSADVLVFPPDSADSVNSVDVRLRDFEIFDNVPTSTWRKFLTHLDNDPMGREMAKPMIHIELLNVRTLENFAASELTMHVSVLPLRLHVDQDALDFITRFFEFKDEATATPSGSNDQPFLQRVEVDTVDLCLDYKPKKVDYVGLRSGHSTEFMNFIILDAANIRLKHAIIYGIKGFEPLHKTLNDVWMPDVKRNQLPTVLAGLAPVRSLVNIGSGVRDVVAIPIREYRKDGRLVRSIQKGAFQFGKTTASELARLGAKVAMGTQTMLQGAEDLLSPASVSPSGRSLRPRLSSEGGWHDIDDDEPESERRAISAYANQPLGVFGGLRSARRYLEHDLLTARDALIAVQGEVLESSSPGSAAAAVARHAPTVILRPIIGTSRAVGTALLGVGNAIDRDNLRRIDDVSSAKKPLTLVHTDFN
jgi:autophagy-related protein 2